MSVVAERARATRPLVLVTALAVGVVTVACRNENPANGTNVLLVGDSLMNGSRDAVTSTLEADGWNPDIEAQGGTTITYWADRIPYLVLTKQPDVVVIELGTNDCSPTDCPVLAGYIDEIMRSVPPDVQVFWLSIQEKIPLAMKRRYINYEIESAYARWPNLHLVDYEKRIENHPEYHTPDGLHLNPAGQQLLADLIRASIAPYQPRG